MPNELSEKVYPDGTVVKLRDDTAREQIATLSSLLGSKAEIVDLGSISATSNNDSIGKAWDAITVYEKPVIVRWFYSGSFMALMYKYNGSQYGMAMAMKYNTTSVLTLSVNNGVKTYGDVANRVAAKSLDSTVDITSYNSSNQYICPKDGYVSLKLGNGAKGTVLVGGRDLLTVSSSQGVTETPFFVKAGMNVYLSDASGTKYLYYRPLQY